MKKFTRVEPTPSTFCVCRYVYIYLEVVSFFFFWGSKQFDFNGLLKYVSTINMVVKEGKKILYCSKTKDLAEKNEKIEPQYCVHMGMGMGRISI